MKQQVILMAAALLLIGATPVWSQFSTGFETSSGYGGNATTVVGVQDVNAPASSTWSNVSGFTGGGAVTSSTVNPRSGAQALRLYDSSASSGTGVELNLAGTTGLSLANPFTIKFSWAYSGVGGTSGPALNAWFGTDSNSTSAKDWMHVNYDTSNDYLGIYLGNSLGTTSTLITLAKFADLASTGSYVSWSLTIDPTSHVYTNVTLSGDLGSVDVTSLVAAYNSGTLPWRSNTAGDPASILWFSTGGAATITAFVDEVSISNVPEPSSMALIGLSLCTLAGLMRRRVS